ncbi:MAG: hypothetical protein JO306_00250 [Gemmatimonadetes bacterium]|nr:hypothetical protein [Gemmatimonadota bacterium]
MRYTALLLKSYLDERKIASFAKTTGWRGIHVYVPIFRRYAQKEVWTAAKNVAILLGKRHPDSVTAEYRITRRPPGRVLVDYNQNAWGRTLASVYSVRAKPGATVSTPVTWDEIEDGVEIEDFTLKNVPARLEKVGDLYRPLLLNRGRFDLSKLI